MVSKMPTPEGIVTLPYLCRSDLTTDLVRFGQNCYEEDLFRISTSYFEYLTFFCDVCDLL